MGANFVWWWGKGARKRQSTIENKGRESENPSFGVWRNPLVEIEIGCWWSAFGATNTKRRSRCDEGYRKRELRTFPGNRKLENCLSRSWTPRLRDFPSRQHIGLPRLRWLHTCRSKSAGFCIWILCRRLGIAMIGECIIVPNGNWFPERELMAGLRRHWIAWTTRSLLKRWLMREGGQGDWMWRKSREKRAICRNICWESRILIARSMRGLLISWRDVKAWNQTSWDYTPSTSYCQSFSI